MNERVLLYVNSSKEKALKVSEKVRKRLKTDGYNIVEENPEIVIGFGGDGTLIRLLNDTGHNLNAKYIGINCGTLGFMQDFLFDEEIKFSDQLKEAEEKNAKFLSLRLYRGNDVYTFYCLNEFFILNDNEKALRTEVYVEDEYLESFAGTGLIFSTQIGSTARNLSAGGNIIYPGVECICMTPSEPIINSKMRSLSKSVCLPSNITINVIPSANHKIKIISDGINICSSICDRIEITYSDKHIVRLVRKNDSFTKKISENFI